jgi:hypothetical protein
LLDLKFLIAYNVVSFGTRDLDGVKSIVLTCSDERKESCGHPCIMDTLKIKMSEPRFVGLRDREDFDVL